MNDFDPDSFMTQTIDAPLDTERTLVPQGEYKMSIGDFTRDAFETIEFTYKKGERAGEEGHFTKFNCPLIIDDEAVRKATSIDRPQIIFSCNLDLDESGQLAWGPNKNIDLGKLRHATGQNNAGPWSVSQLRGAGPFMGKVAHREGKRKDGSNFKLAEVVRFAPIR